MTVVERDEVERLARIEQQLWNLRCRSNLTAWAIEALEPMEQLPAKHHRVLLDYLKRVQSGEIDRLMVCMPPGHAKSTYCSVLYPPWAMAQRPHLQVIGASHGADLAEDFSSMAQGHIRQHPEILGYRLKTENVKRWRTTNGGFYRAAGVGGSITGRRADLGIIDDPVKSAAEAESLTMREATWQWYTTDFYSRLKPGAAIVVIMCMAGETPVRMADGTERRLDAINVGDAVATYENGQLSTTKVLGWKNQGKDDIYEIRMSSGRSVRANERHPFLVQRGDSTEWVRLRNLCPGDRIAALPAENVTSPQSAKGSAPRTTASRDGQLAFDRPRIIRRADAPRACGTGTASSQANMTRFSRIKGVCALSADVLRLLKRTIRIGRIDSRSTTIMRQASCAGSSATTVTSCSATRATTRSGYAPPSPISFGWDEVVSVEAAGRAIVYDVQIERTENFIANGLVSHNTRWHEDDLGGRLLAAAESGGDKWTLLKMPAICDSLDDPLGRRLGEALWPEWQDETALARIRANVLEHVWGTLYQQDPKPRGASFFDVDELLVNAADLVLPDGRPAKMPAAMPDKCDTVFAIVDTAIKAGLQHNSTAVTYWSYNSLTNPPTYILDWDIVQIEGADQAAWLPSVFARCEELARQCGAREGSVGALIEDKATGTVLLQQARNIGQPAHPIDSKLTAMGKEERAIAAAPYVTAGGVKITDQAWDKTKVHKGRSANHLISQVTGFRIGSKETDGLDLLDTFCYGVLIASGNSKGF